MTDLMDTPPVLETDEPPTPRPPLLRWIGTGVAAVLLVGLGAVLAEVRNGAPSTATSAPVAVIGQPLATTTSTSHPQVESSPPAVPCVSWTYGADHAHVLVVNGNPCVNATVEWAGATAASATLAGSPTSVSIVQDPMLHTQSAVVPGQIYGDVVVMLEHDAATGGVDVVGRSLATFGAVWSHGCNFSATMPAVHFSGGDVDRDPAANRTDVPVFGVTSYVAVDCGAGPVLYDPASGARL
ncbi:MAG: hypothetical protein JWM34_2627 [Ilumatobacteraceae bacterium]|nr:hypothetical protein [Ilumatobacteraceae bacterium]